MLRRNVNIDDFSQAYDSYTYGHDLLSQHNSTYGPAYYHYDAQLSTCFLTDPAANIVNTYEYSAFGPFLTHTASFPNPFTYTYEYFDPESSLLYLRARYLSSLQGRFLSVDPVEHSTAELNPMRYHPYIYGLNSPIQQIDPGGQFSYTGSLVSLAISSWLSTQVLGMVAGALKGDAFPDATIVGIQFNVPSKGPISDIIVDAIELGFSYLSKSLPFMSSILFQQMKFGLLLSLDPLLLSTTTYGVSVGVECQVKDHLRRR